MRVFSERLKLARENHYVSAEQFAHILTMSPHAYRKYERGESEPNFETLTRICQLLKVDPNYFLPEAAGEAKRRPIKAGRRRIAA